MDRAHHFADDRKTRLGDQVEVRGDRADERVLDGEQAQRGAPREHRSRDVAKLAIRLRPGIGIQQEERLLAVGARLALERYQLVRHWLRLTDRHTCRQWSSGYIRGSKNRPPNQQEPCDADPPSATAPAPPPFSPAAHSFPR